MGDAGAASTFDANAMHWNPGKLAELDAGNLKGRKIGTQWRITKDAVDAFLKG